jgi:GH15 family glucan-1,4-alpha-glucosidase
VLRALTYEPTGAVAAAATASLPEAPGGVRNWDYRYAWVRDSTFAVRALADLGHEDEADRFRRFVERSAAGHAGDLHIAYGVGGERRIPELELDLEGYRGARPVRIGNGAAAQFQLDALGLLVDLTYRWHRRGHSPDDDHWRFLVDLVDRAAEAWREPDCGLWEWRGEPRHFVHSKVMCWAALDRGLRLARECLRKAPQRRWERARDEIRAAVEREGVDGDRGAFIQAFGHPRPDGASCSSRSSTSCRSTTRACWRRPTGSGTSWTGAGWCAATTRTTACPDARAPSWPARSGSPRRLPTRAGGVVTAGGS